MRKKRSAPVASSSDEEEAPPSKKKKAASKKRKSAGAAAEAAPAPARKKAKKKKSPAPGKLARGADKAVKRTKKKPSLGPTASPVQTAVGTHRSSGTHTHLCPLPRPLDSLRSPSQRNDATLGPLWLPLERRVNFIRRTTRVPSGDRRRRVAATVTSLARADPSLKQPGLASVIDTLVLQKLRLAAASAAAPLQQTCGGNCSAQLLTLLSEDASACIAAPRPTPREQA